MQDSSNRKDIRKMVLTIILMAIYVGMSAFGLILMKKGVNNGFTLSFTKGSMNLKMSLIFILGVLFYITSFILSVMLMSKLNLNILYPISAGLIYVVVAVASVFMLKEPINTLQFVGMILILAGIVVMNIKQGV